jgi:hypothetical protein
MLRSWAVAVALLVPIAGLCPGEAQACSCAGPNPVCQTYWKTDAVFDATVVSIGHLTRERVTGRTHLSMTENLVRLSVNESWKGAEPGDIEVVTESRPSACGFDFQVGERYIVFANHRLEDGRLEVTLCSNTRRYDRQGDFQFFLSSLSSPATGGRVFGSVRTYDQLFGPTSESEAPYEAQIRLTGQGKDVTTLSSAGRYEFANLVPGSYQVDITVPEGYAAYGARRTVRIENDRACRQEDYSVSPAGRIVGRLFDANGRPLPHVLVEVTTSDARSTPDGPEAIIAPTGPDGDFVVEHLSPGRYIVGINLRDAVDAQHPYPRTIYPGGDPGPQVIELRLGQTVQLPDWRLLPPKATTRPLRYP